MITPSVRNGDPGDLTLLDQNAIAERLGNENRYLEADAERFAAPDLRRFLAEIKGQAQFLLYLADQIEDSLDQLVQESDDCHSAFLCKVLGMYSNQLESKHSGLGEKIAEACQEVYVTVRERELL
jgi:hypothetical protein